MKKIKLFFLAVLLINGTGLWAQAVGDYGSNATNNAWNTASNWLVCVTAGTWDGATTATTAPASTTNIWIRSGHTVTLPGSGNCLCNNLYVDGTLISANVVTSPRYIRLYGNTLVINGTFGSASDGLGIQLYGGATQSLVISGSGTVYFSRIQPQTAAAITFDVNAQFDYAGSGGAGSTSLYANNLDYSVTINEGKTVTLSENSYLAIHGSSGSSAGSSNFVLNVNGTLIGSGSNSAINLNAISGKTVSVSIGAKGEIKTYAPLRSNYLNAATSTVTIANGGKISGMTGSTISLSKSNITNNGTISLAGTNADSLGTSTVSSTGSIVVNKTSNNIALAGNTTINGLLTLTSGTVSLGASNLTIGSTGSISGGSSTSYIITNGIGRLTQTIAGGSSLLFPIGASSGSYDPVSLTPTAGTDISAKVGTTLTGTAASGYVYNQKEWSLTSATPSATVVSFTPSAISATGPYFIIGQYADGNYVNKLSTTQSGTTYSASFDNFTSFVTGTSDTATELAKSANQSVTVSALHNTITINGTTTGQNIEVYSTSGQIIKQVKVLNTTTTINMQPGAYILKTGSDIRKIVL